MAPLCWTFLSCLWVWNKPCATAEKCVLWLFSPYRASLAGGEGRAEGKKRRRVLLYYWILRHQEGKYGIRTAAPFAHCKDVPQHLCWLSHGATSGGEKLLLSPSLVLLQNPSQRGRVDSSHSLQPHCGITTHCPVSSAQLFGQVCVICVPLPVPTGMKLWEGQSQHRRKAQGNPWPGNQTAAGSCCQSYLWWCQALPLSEMLLVSIKHF